MNCEDSARLVDINSALGLLSESAEAEEATYCDGSKVAPAALPKSSDADFLKFERQQREERIQSAQIERSLHRIAAGSAWPRTDEIDHEAVAKVF